MELPMGEKPTGYAVFTREGRVFFILTGELREPATNDEERAGLLNTLVAYTGTYRVEGNKWITKVDAAWNVEWLGTDQERFFTLSGNRLNVVAQWNRNALYGGEITRGHLTFERET